MDKIIPIYKPVGLSSFDLIRKYKREHNFKGKIGHGGTLDPFACGLVLLLLGKATKEFDEIKKWHKTYLAGLRLGSTSTTGDPAGEITASLKAKDTITTKVQIEKVIQGFIGEIDQQIPAYSAAKYKGQPFYKLAKQGKAPNRSKKVNIKNIEIIAYKYPFLTLRVTVSGGTYIRQLAEDIGKELDIGAYLYYLERQSIGKFSIDKIKDRS